MAKFDDDDGTIKKAKISSVIQTMKAKSKQGKRAALTRHGKKPNENNDGDENEHSGGNAIKDIETNISIDIEDFEKFYSVYPATPHSSRPAAMREWEKLSDAHRGHCVAVISLYVATTKGADPKFIKSPQGFLSNQMFLNYTPPKKSAPVKAPEAGTDERKLWDAAKAHGIASTTWVAWLSAGKVTIRGGVIYPRNTFTHQSIAQKFGPVIQSAGLELANVGATPPTERETA